MPVQTPAEPNAVIQGLWIGAELSVMEQLSISSFLLNGHEYHLYVYEAMKNVPVGTVLKDADEILPSSRIFFYPKRQTYAGFANFFRYKLLLERGGWWVDTDVVCLKPFDFATEHVFATDNVGGVDVPTSGVIKAPVGSRAMAYAWDVCQSKNPAHLRWGETGPRLVREVVERFSLQQFQVPHHVFSPIGYGGWFLMLRPEERIVLDEGTYAVHLWHEMWRIEHHDKNAAYPQDCLYEQLKERYLRVPSYGWAVGPDAR